MSEKISVMVTTENMEQMQMAAMIASVGAVSGNDVSVFLSMNALKYFMKGNDHKAPLEGEMGKTMLEKNVPPFFRVVPTSCRTWRRKNISLFNGNGYVRD